MRIAKNSFHVLPSPKGGWTVKKGSVSRAAKHFVNKEDAIVWGRKASKTEGAEFVLHGRDGTIRQRNTYGEDPNVVNYVLPEFGKLVRPERKARTRRKPRMIEVSLNPAKKSVKFHVIKRKKRTVLVNNKKGTVLVNK